MNVYLFCGNLVHLLAFYLLIYDIFKKRNCAGISGKTQLLYTMVFTCRYTDLVTNYISFYNSALKTVFIVLSLLLIYLIYYKYEKSYQEEHDTFWNTLLICPAAVLGISVNYCTLNGFRPYLVEQEIFWTFSIYLEVVAIIPQYYMSRKSGEARRVLSYLLCLCLYRSLYILNWIYRYIEDGHIDCISWISGSLQTLILIFVIINIQQRKEQLPKWQEITEVFTIEATKVEQLTKSEFNNADKEQSDEKRLLSVI